MPKITDVEFQGASDPTFRKHTVPNTPKPAKVFPSGLKAAVMGLEIEVVTSQFSKP